MLATVTRLIPFQAEHLFEFKDRDWDVLPTFEEGRIKQRGGPAFTAVINDKIVGCAGIQIMWPGVGSGWVCFGKEIERHPIWFTKMVRAVVQDTIRVYKLHRIEAQVLVGEKQNHQWARLLGFTLERNACARKYTQDERSIARYELIP